MNNFFRALIAGYGAKKLGGGCFSTIIIFIAIYYLLGTCNRGAHATPVSNPVPAKIHSLHKPAPTAVNGSTAVKY